MFVYKVFMLIKKTLMVYKREGLEEHMFSEGSIKCSRGHQNPLMVHHRKSPSIVYNG
jgi:hypothetical protein